MRKLLLGLAALVVLLVLVDFGAAISTEYRMSRAVRSGSGLGSDPEVTVSAFPFLWAVPRGHADAVTVSTADAPTAIGYRTTVEARFEDVTFTGSGAFPDPAAPIEAERATATWVIGQTSLGRLLGIPELEVSEPPEDEDAAVEAGSRTYGPPLSARRVMLTGKVQTSADESGPIRRTVSVIAYLVLDGGTLSIVPRAVWPHPSAPGTVSGPVPSIDVVGPQFALTIDTGHMPYGIAATRAHTAGTNIVVAGDAEDVRADLTHLGSAVTGTSEPATG